MAIAHVTSSSWDESTASTSFTRSFNNTGTSGDILLVVVSQQNNYATHQISSVTYNGVALTNKIEENSNVNYRLTIWALNGASEVLATGANNLVASGPSTNTRIAWGAMILSGQATSPYGATNHVAHDAGGATSGSDSITTTASNSWHTCGFYVSAGVNGYQDVSSSDSTIRIEQNETAIGWTVALSTDLVTTASSNTITYTWADADNFNGLVSLEIKEASTATTTTPISNMLLMGV